VSIQSVRDGLITVLTAASAFDASQVSGCDYGILETSDSCAIMVMPVGIASEPITFGAPRQRLVTWEIEIQAYVKDIGDTITVLSNVWTIADEVRGALDSDDTLDGSCKKSKITGAAQPKGSGGGPEMLDAGGATWIPWYFTVAADQF